MSLCCLWKYIYICVCVCLCLYKLCVTPCISIMCMETGYTHMFKTMYVCVSMCVYSYAHTYAAPGPQIKAWVGQCPCVVETGLFGKANQRAALSIASM